MNEVYERTLRKKNEAMRTLLPEGPSNLKEATPKQLAALAKLGYTDPQPLTIAAASELIERLIAEQETMITSAKVAAERLNLIDLASARVELRRESAKEWSGPCPKCGGTDRFHVQESKFMCRSCHPDWGDGIEWLAWTNGANFLNVCRDLAGGTVSTAINVEVVKPVSKPSTTPYVWDEQKQRREALEGHGKLLEGKSKQSKIVLAYLEGRGIETETIKAFSVGYAAMGLPNTYDKPNRSRCYPMQVAVSLPWFNHDGALQCVKYRFTQSHTYTDMDGKERTENKTSRGSSSGGVFGWQALQGPDKRKVLIITEGEMNALSLWQAGNEWIDVLSAGAEGAVNNLPTVVTELANRYVYRIVWADKGNIANSVAFAIGAASMRSPTGMDANDLLQAGKLAPLLVAMLKRLGVDTGRTDVHEHVHEPVQSKPSDFVGQVVSAQRFYELQSETSAMGWILHGKRHGELIDGYCDEWLITKAVHA